MSFYTYLGDNAVGTTDASGLAPAVPLPNRRDLPCAGRNCSPSITEPIPYDWWRDAPWVGPTIGVGDPPPPPSQTQPPPQIPSPGPISIGIGLGMGINCQLGIFSVSVSASVKIGSCICESTNGRICIRTWEQIEICVSFGVAIGLPGCRPGTPAVRLDGQYGCPAEQSSGPFSICAGCSVLGSGCRACINIASDYDVSFRAKCSLALSTGEFASCSIGGRVCKSITRYTSSGELACACRAISMTMP